MDEIEIIRSIISIDGYVKADYIINIDVKGVVTILMTSQDHSSMKDSQSSTLYDLVSINKPTEGSLCSGRWCLRSKLSLL